MGPVIDALLNEPLEFLRGICFVSAYLFGLYWLIRWRRPIRKLMIMMELKDPKLRDDVLKTLQAEDDISQRQERLNKK